jgi:hypothetical protein
LAVQAAQSAAFPTILAFIVKSGSREPDSGIASDWTRIIRKGIRRMKMLQPVALRQAVSRQKLDALTQQLLKSSLIVYLVAVVAQRTWMLLNSDVLQLLRRLH